MKSSLEKLKEIQLLDQQIFRRRQEEENLPLEIRSKTQEVNDIKQKAHDIHQRLLQLEAQQKQKQGELDELEELIRKREIQLNSVETNREYSALLQEINSQKAAKSLLEDEIFAIIEEMERSEEEQKEVEKQIGEKENEYRSFTKEHQARLLKVKSELEGLEAKRKGMVAKIDPELLDKYERILASKGSQGQALVDAYGTIDSAFCGACHIQLLPNDIAALVGGSTPVFCNNCGRLLAENFEDASKKS